MSAVRSLAARRGLRGKLLAAPAIAILVMVAVGVFTAQRLDHAAALSKSLAARTTEVEMLRDSNSRQFESDRQMYLAIHATDRKAVADAVGEAHDTLEEATDGYRAFALGALTPRLRALGTEQADMMGAIGTAREAVLKTVQAGRPITESRLAAVEDKVDAADEANDALVTAEQKVVDGIAKDSATSAAHAKRLLLVLVVLALLAATAVAVLVVRGIMRGVRQVLDAADGIAEGDLEQHVDVRSNDEIGELASAFGRMIDYLKGSADVAGRVAEGDLTVEVEPRSPRDVLGTAFARMVGQLRELATMLSGSASSLSSASQEMAQTSEQAGRAVGEIASAVSDVAQGAERQVRAVEQARRATEEVASASDMSARNAHATAEAALAARAVAEQGATAVSQASDAMVAVRDQSREATRAIRELGAKSEQIGGIVETITGIAEQTNLLALNAAIEAARAGEQGRGFAVVAEEVRKLAEDSQRAAGNIAHLVAEIQEETARTVSVVEDGARQTEDGVATVEQAREAFLTLGASVQDMNSRVEEIATAIEQIVHSSQQVQTDMGDVAAVAEESSASSEQVSASTHETSASTQQIAASARALASTAEDLQRLVGQFTLTHR